MSEILGIIITILLVVGFIVIFVLLSRKKGEDQFQDAKLKEVKEEIGKIRQEMQGSLVKNLDFLQKQSSASNIIVREVTSKLEKLEATNKQVINFTDQLQNLQDILKNPKQRGVLGEYYLETVLKNVLPPQAYQMQYGFENGDKVDAVIFIKDKIIPIDSKYSLENYNRILEEKNQTRREELEKVFKQDLKNRIDETAKYIRPKENTMDFAFMFIPSEGIYYDLLINQVGSVKISTRDLIEYAFKDRHVIIASPTSFFAYLQTVLQGLRALQFEESAKEIRKRVESLGRHLMNFDSYMQKLGNNLSTTANTYNTAYKEFKKVDKDVLKISGKGGKVEPKNIEGPKA